MPTRIRLIWIIITIAFLGLNSALNYSSILGVLNLIPLIMTGYIMTTYRNEFKYNTPWGIPYYLLMFINIRNFEKTINRAASSYGLEAFWAPIL